MSRHQPLANSDGAPRTLDRLRVTAEGLRVATSLHGQTLPAVELRTARMMTLPLMAHVARRTVVYFLPGDPDTQHDSGSPTPDTDLHGGYSESVNAFEEIGVRIICVSSGPLASLATLSEWSDFTLFMFSDPELTIGQALPLPTVTCGKHSYYEPITLVTENGRITRAFYPIPDAAGNAAHVLEWMRQNGDTGRREAPRTLTQDHDGGCRQ